MGLRKRLSACLELVCVLQVFHGFGPGDGSKDRSGFPGSHFGSVHSCCRPPGRQREGRAASNMWKVPTWTTHRGFMRLRCVCVSVWADRARSAGPAGRADGGVADWRIWSQLLRILPHLTHQGEDAQSELSFSLIFKNSLNREVNQMNVWIQNKPSVVTGSRLCFHLGVRVFVSAPSQSVSGLQRWWLGWGDGSHSVSEPAAEKHRGHADRRRRHHLQVRLSPLLRRH